MYWPTVLTVIIYLFVVYGVVICNVNVVGLFKLVRLQWKSFSLNYV